MQAHYGCEQFKGLCCFNLSDNSHAVNNQLDLLNDLIQDVKQRKGSIIDEIWNTLTSWLPDISWLKRAFMYTIGIIATLILCCCIAQCLPYVVSITRTMFRPKPTPILTLELVEQTPCLPDPPQNVQVQIWGKSHF